MKIYNVIILWCFASLGRCRKPNVVLILGDDMGWNDVSFHGSNQIPTPNIDALGYNGIILNRFYTQATCTPSRTALLTGNYPIRSAMQGYPMKAGENRYIPLHMSTLPEHLKNLGYKTHLVGKWHLGYAYKKVSPLGRGFDSHFGYWNGYVGYYDYEIAQGDFVGFDMRENFSSHYGAKGRYATDLFTERADAIIKNHNKSEPLFLMVSHLAPHTGKNGSELEVPDVNKTNEKYFFISDERRRLYAGMVERLDHSVGQIVKSLSEKNMLDNTIVIYISDNGGQTIGVHENLASNWPLRGLKFTLLEGGVRGVAVVYSPKFHKKGTVSNELMHISDWMPTIYEAAGGNLEDLGQIDGRSQWNVMLRNTKTNRKEILLDIDEVLKMSAIIGYGGKYKLVNGTFQNGIYDQHYGETGRGPENPQYNIQDVLNSELNTALQNLDAGEPLTKEKIQQLRSKVDLRNCREENAPNFVCEGICLFDLEKDPCETQNIADKFSQVVDDMSGRLLTFFAQLVPQGDRTVDRRSNPKYFNNTWSNWLENLDVPFTACHV